MIISLSGEEFAHTSDRRQESEDCFEVLRLPARQDLGGHTLSIFYRGDTFEIAYSDPLARGTAEQLLIFGDRMPEEGAFAVIEWLQDFVEERIVVVRYRYRRLWGEPYTLIFFRRRGEKIKKRFSDLLETYDNNANAV